MNKPHNQTQPKLMAFSDDAPSPEELLHRRKLHVRSIIEAHRYEFGLIESEINELVDSLIDEPVEPSVGQIRDRLARVKVEREQAERQRVTRDITAFDDQFAIAPHGPLTESDLAKIMVRFAVTPKETQASILETLFAMV